MTNDQFLEKLTIIIDQIKMLQTAIVDCYMGDYQHAYKQGKFDAIIDILDSYTHI